MPDDYHPPMPRRNPEDIDLDAIKADMELLIEWVTRFRKEQALKPVYTMIGSTAIRHRLDRAFLATLPVKINLARGLHRTWIVGSILWIIPLKYHYESRCDFYSTWVVCWYLPGNGHWLYNTYKEFIITVAKLTIGIPVLAFILGTLALWIGRWVGKGFQPSQTVE